MILIALKLTWRVNFEAEQQYLSYNASSSLLILCNYMKVDMKTGRVRFYAMDSRTGRFSASPVELGATSQYNYDSMAVFYFTAPRRGILLTCGAVRLMEIDEDLNVEILDTFDAPPAHVFRASTYSFNILLLEVSNHFGYTPPEDTDVLILHIDNNDGSGKIVLKENRLRIKTPTAMCLDRNFDLYTIRDSSTIKYRLET
jgi:hypothetical protein